LLSNILLTPFDREMRPARIQLTRYADDWAVTCRVGKKRKRPCVRGEILATLGVQLNVRKTRIVHVREDSHSWLHDQAWPAGALSANARSRRKVRRGGLYAYPTQKSTRPVQGLGPPEDATPHPASHGGADPRTQSCDSRMGRVLQTRSRTETLHQLDRWVVRRLWSHRYRRWRVRLEHSPDSRLRGELGW